MANIALRGELWDNDSADVLRWWGWRDVTAPMDIQAALEAAVSEDEAGRLVDGSLEVLSHQLALIPTAGEYEVLCHEFKCQAEDGSHVLVYVNAATGQEEKILLLLEDENGTLTL